ncbi:glycoside hydrolase family 32 protein [Mesorhizobium sp. BR1-1-16]|uniref:GH32 C-terminal domain-containing protein n=1 Tax=Mesorhizobium sp. BR1-1-16 TaxID=2876653 RepID=UPI001CCF1BD0|nr:GH32 C-terminal domain-containing protein [Mesorhizobium sp. BR1-1-16]MBZ9935764.1 glycoside hydrolase family 32 protein [Mesorhizobium sp. BR1-1-16]
MKIDFALNLGETLHVFQKPVGDAAGSVVVLATADRGERVLRGPVSDDFTQTEARDLAAGPASLSFDDGATAVSLAYAFDPKTVLKTGIRTLFTTERNRPNTARHLLHLAPPFGWMNDPNGLSQAEGLTHLFYQHYPHSHRWNTMHWGHAVTSNGVDWTHLPITVLPRPELLASDEKVGGVFSGSAINLPDGGLRLYYTDREDDRLPNWEWQMTAVTKDLVTVGPSSPVVSETPSLPGFGKNFRDPYVFKGPDGLWKMVLGGGTDTAAVVLLYETDDPDGVADWRFVGVVHQEPTTQKLPAECPCMVALDGEGEGLHALILGLLGSRDEVSRRRNVTVAMIGRFDGKSFAPIERFELDYGTDAYAFQGIAGADGPFGFAWAANWTDVFKDRDFASAMTFPRRLVWKDGKLFTPPLETVAALRLPEPPITLPPAASPVALNMGLGEIEIEIGAKGEPFDLAFAHPTFGLSLGFDGHMLELHFKAPGTRPSPRYFIEDIAPEKLRIFVDVGLIEIYVDDGRWCITKRIDSDEPIESVTLSARPDTIASATLRHLRPQGT